MHRTTRFLRSWKIVERKREERESVVGARDHQARKLRGGKPRADSRLRAHGLAQPRQE